MPEIPVRNIRDPRILRAIAHPVRLRLLEELGDIGTATATELAERIGESPANCSWHLRQLARYGYVEEAGGGAGRQRPWRVVVQSNTWGRDDDNDTELAVAGDIAAEMVFNREFDALREWQQTRRAAPPQWREAAFTAQTNAWLTPDELIEARHLIDKIFERYLAERIDPEQRPPDARMIRMVAWAVPRLAEEEFD